MRKLAVWLVIIPVLVCPAASPSADKTPPPPLSVQFLFQPQIQLTENDAPDRASSRAVLSREKEPIPRPGSRGASEDGPYWTIETLFVIIYELKG